MGEATGSLSRNIVERGPLLVPFPILGPLDGVLPMLRVQRFVLRVVLLVCCLALTREVCAQSINFDYSTNFGAPPHPWYDAPSDAWGGSPGQTGHWVDSGANVFWNNLAGLDGNPTAVDLSLSGGGPVYFQDDPVLNGDIETMMGDWINANPGDPITLTFTHLLRGVYTVYTYANNLWCPNCRTNVAVAGSPDPVQVVGGAITVNAPVEGITHARQRVYTTNGTIIVGISANTTLGSFNGIQLVYHGDPGPTMYVDHDATGSGVGLFWGSACLRVEDALTVASMTGNIVQQIWVAEGTYRTTRSGDRAESFILRDGLKVYGGFAGNETQLSQRDFNAHLTTLSGAINNPLLLTDNAYHVVDLSNTTSSTRLDGFRISSGYASGPSTGSFGGGVFMNNSSAAVRNCTITGNHADFGGGVWSSGDSPDFVNCTFLNNTSESPGGGARIVSGGQVASFYNCRFFGNDAGTVGGGASVANQQAWFVNCLFSGNTAVDEGGGVHSSGEAADILMVNSTLAGNSSTGAACGGIYMTGGADDEIVNCILWGNTDADPLTNTRQTQYFALDGTSTQTLNYDIVQGWNIITGTGNNGSNPLFVDANGPDNIVGTSDDNLHVQVVANSPAIDSGSNGDIPIDFADVDDDGVLLEFTPLDLDGHNRRKDIASVADSGAGSAPIVDRGPYEAQPPCPADINGSNSVNVDDLLAVITGWGACPAPCPPHCAADIAPPGGNCVVNVDDLLLVITSWGACP